MRDMNLCEGCEIMPPGVRRREVPLLAACVAAGAKVYKNYRGRDDTVAIEVDGERCAVSVSDYEVVARVLKVIGQQWRGAGIMSVGQMVSLIRAASVVYDRMGDEREGKKGIVMLKDRSGAGYWRMVFPAKYMDKTGIYVDVTSAGARFESLMEYETVMVQRIHDWESYYLLERLKEAGKRVVYDIDDDIFNIDRDNPASRIIGRDEQMAAVACMVLADVVTTTVEPLRAVIRDVTGTVDAVVVPNAVDMDDGWRPTPLTGSPDGIKRVFWQGGDTHGDDWTECVDAVDALMGERTDMRLVVLGYLPPAVATMLGRGYWKGRVEFLEFRDPETYFQMMKHVRAEVGLAPLKNTLFNQSKSPLKFVEYSAVGMPTVASRVQPYVDAIENGVDGMLVDNSTGWFDAISSFLDDQRKRLSVLEAARKKVRSGYDIRKVAAIWRSVLIP